MVSTDNDAVVAQVIVSLAFTAGVGLRVWWVPCIDLLPNEVVIRSVLRTRRIPWSSIRDADVTRGSSVFLVPWRVPRFTLTDNSTILADDVRSLHEPSIVDAVVEEARTRINAPSS
jgi:hypothetical protein